MNTLYLVRGVPGSGKTTLAELLKSNSSIVSISSDDYPSRYVDGIINLELTAKSHDWCLEQTKLHLSEGKDVVVHNTFYQKKFLNSFLELRQELSVNIHVIHSEAVILKNGNYSQSSHNVPQKITQRQLDSFEPFRKPAFDGLGMEYALSIFKMDLSQYNFLATDLDGTLITFKDDNPFNRELDNLDLNEDFMSFLCSNFYGNRRIKIPVFSNQRGVMNGYLNLSQLLNKLNAVWKLLCRTNLDSYFESFWCAIENNKYIEYLPNEQICNSYPSPEVSCFKPSSVMFDMYCHKYNMYESNRIYIGDAHEKTRHEDYHFALSINASYFPVEMVSLHL